MRRVALLLLLCGVACRTDRTVVANFAAAYTYHEHRYEWACVDQVGPTSCEAFRRLLRQAKLAATTANEVEKIGTLPPSERQQLKDLYKALEAAK